MSSNDTRGCFGTPQLKEQSFKYFVPRFLWNSFTILISYLIKYDNIRREYISALFIYSFKNFKWKMKKRLAALEILNFSFEIQNSKFHETVVHTSALHRHVRRANSG